MPADLHAGVHAAATAQPLQLEWGCRETRSSGPLGFGVRGSGFSTCVSSPVRPSPGIGLLILQPHHALTLAQLRWSLYSRQITHGPKKIETALRLWSCAAWQCPGPCQPLAGLMCLSWKCRSDKWLGSSLGGLCVRQAEHQPLITCPRAAGTFAWQDRALAWCTVS